MMRVAHHFAYGHLPPGLQEVSKRFHELAMWMSDNLPDSTEKYFALRKLLEAKDCAVRARLGTPDMPEAQEAQCDG